MKRIDFYKKKKALHNKMLEAIATLFDKVGFDEIDFMPDGELNRNCWIIVSSGGADSTYEERVRKVRCINGWVEVMLKGCDEWISCEWGGDIVADSLDDLYDTVYDAIGDINHVYYVCELDESGKPTGSVKKETWRLEYAERMKEERGYIYNAYQTALMHALDAKLNVKN